MRIVLLRKVDSWGGVSYQEMHVVVSYVGGVPYSPKGPDWVNLRHPSSFGPTTEHHVTNVYELPPLYQVKDEKL
jgi:hypothetical protein